MHVDLIQNAACHQVNLRGHQRERPSGKMQDIKLNIVSLDIVVPIDARRARESLDSQLASASSVDGLHRRVELRNGRGNRHSQSRRRKFDFFFDTFLISTLVDDCTRIFAWFASELAEKVCAGATDMRVKCVSRRIVPV